MTSQLYRLAFKHVLVQAALLGVLMVLALLGNLGQYVGSLFLGGLASIVPNGYFAWRISRKTGANTAKSILKDFYRGEMVKLLLTALIFLLIFQLIPVTILAVFVGFITAQAAFWVSLLILRSERAVT